MDERLLRLATAGATELTSATSLLTTPSMSLPGTDAFRLRGLFGLFRKPLKWLLKKIAKLAHKAKNAWDKVGNLLQFFRTLLRSERKIFRSLRDSYGPRQKVELFVHHLLDMELAYKPRKPPRYRFSTDQLWRMRRLAADSDGLVLGFSAFDPHRDDWRDIVNASIKQGFCGFKFYPAMGYRPDQNDDKDIQKRVDAFFHHCCADLDIPIFTHCTPKGFEASDGSGLNGHPKYWRSALVKHPDLRVCFGHAGGGDYRNKGLHSYGWYAETPKQWKAEDNFARIVVELCAQYKNAYCEIAYMDEVLHDADIAKNFKTNFGVYPGFPIRLGALPGFVVGDLMWNALWKLVENEQRFPRRGGRVLCVHGAVSFHRARPCVRPVCRPGSTRAPLNRIVKIVTNRASRYRHRTTSLS